MGPFFVVEAPPKSQFELSIGEVGKGFRIEEFGSESAVEALDLGILPWRAWLDEAAFGSRKCQPHGERVGHELGSLVRPKEFRLAQLLEEACQHRSHLRSFDAGRHLKRKALPGELVHPRQDLQPGSVETRVMNEVEAP